MMCDQLNIFLIPFRLGGTRETALRHSNRIKQGRRFGSAKRRRW